MTNMLFGVMGNNDVPVDEKVVRATATPVQVDAPPAVQKEAPEWNEGVEADTNPQLGMVNRTLASHWVEGQQYAPFWEGQVNDQVIHNVLIDKQVSTSGTAAAREAAGQFGHGTASYAVGIEPQQDLQGPGGFGNEYMSVGKPDIQSTSGDYMTVPPGYDQTNSIKASAAGKTYARNANAGGVSPYDVFWNGGK